MRKGGIDGGLSSEGGRAEAVQSACLQLDNGLVRSPLDSRYHKIASNWYDKDEEDFMKKQAFGCCY